MGGALKVLQEKKVKNLVLVGFMAQLGPNAIQIYTDLGSCMSIRYNGMSHVCKSFASCLTIRMERVCRRHDMASVCPRGARGTCA